MCTVAALFSSGGKETSGVGVGSDRLQPSGRGPHGGPDGFSPAPGGMGRVCLELGCSPGIGAGGGGAESVPGRPTGYSGAGDGDAHPPLPSPSGRDPSLAEARRPG